MKRVAEVVGKVLEAVYASHTATGNPSHADRRDMAPPFSPASMVGIVPKDITWDADMGNRRWDGAVLALQAIGVDVGKAIAEGDVIEL